MPKHALRNTTGPSQKLGRQGGNANRAIRASRQRRHVIRNCHVHVVYPLDDHALSRPSHRLPRGRRALALRRLHHLQQQPLNPQHGAMGLFLSFVTSPIHPFRRTDWQLERPENILRQGISQRSILTLRMRLSLVTRCQRFLGLVNIHRIRYPEMRDSSPITCLTPFFHQSSLIN